MSAVREHLLDRRLARRQRWIAYSPMLPKSVAAHSYYVARIARRICHLLKANSNINNLDIDVLKVVDMALMHDEPEAATGDIPLPLEHAESGIKKKQVQALREEYARIRQGDYFVKLWQEFNDDHDSLEKQIVAAADAIAGYAECQEELDVHNDEFRGPSERYVMIMAQLDYDWFKSIKDELGFGGIGEE